MTTPMTIDTPAPRPAPSTHPGWTILLYLAGDNNLSEECVYALKEIKKIGTGLVSTGRDGSVTFDPKLHVIAQFDPLGRGNRTRRFRIRGAGGDGSLLRDNIKDFAESDTTLPETLLDFLCESIRDFRSDHYMVILSGHGAGINEGFFLEDDERPLSSIPSSFPIHALKQVFRSTRLKELLGNRKIDILGFDACMMSTVEICYQLRNTGILNLVLGSEGFALNSSWPFERVIERIKGEPNISPEDLARYMVTTYAKFYDDYALGGLSVDQSVIRVDAISDLRVEIDQLADAMVREFEKESPGHHKHYDPSGHKKFQDAILLAHWGAQSYNGEQCVDLHDFCDLLQQRWGCYEDRSKYDSIWQCCQRVKEGIRYHLVLRSCYSGSAFQFSYGISIYFPWAEFDIAKSYNGSLDFVRDSRWHRFLRTYLRATKRLPRQRDIKIFGAPHRSTPPTSKGPQGVVHSMRNPPTDSLTQCFEEKER